MKVETILGTGFRGKLGNLVFYVRNGKTCVRRLKAAGTKPKERTDRQKALSRRFLGVQMAYKYYREAISEEIWRVAGKEQGRMAHNLFHSKNYACFDREGHLAKPDLFHFADGSLQLPPGLEVEALGEGRMAVRWEADEEWESCRGSDVLKAGVIYAGNQDSFSWAEECSGRREECSGEVRVRTGKGTAHVFLFFAREDGTAYSPSKYFRLTMKD